MTTVGMEERDEKYKEYNMGCIKHYLVNYTHRAGIDKRLKNAVQNSEGHQERHIRSRRWVYKMLAIHSRNY